MKEQQICQSCGMPIDNSTFGKETDGSFNEDYCCYCYVDGHFTQNCTMEEMIQHCAQFVEEFNKDAEIKVTKEQAIANMQQFFPLLKRWKN